MAVRVFILELDRLFCDSMRTALATREEIELVGSSADAKTALLSASNRDYDVLLVDSGSTKCDRHRVLRRLRRTGAEARPIVIGLVDEDALLLRFITAGARGYVTREASFQHLFETIRAVHQERTLCSPRLAALVARKIARMERRLEQLEPGSSAVLTAREQEVLRWMATGLSNKEIAQRLAVSTETVRTHAHNLFKKLRVGNRGAAIRAACRLGLVPHAQPDRSILH